MAAALTATVEALILATDLLTTGPLLAFLFHFCLNMELVLFISCEEVVISHLVLVSMEMAEKKETAFASVYKLFVITFFEIIYHNLVVCKFQVQVLLLKTDHVFSFPDFLNLIFSCHQNHFET